jgi:hypothetical protein
LVAKPRQEMIVYGGDGGELNSRHGPTVAGALRDLSMALARLANTLDVPAKIKGLLGFLERIH